MIADSEMYWPNYYLYLHYHRRKQFDLMKIFSKNCYDIIENTNLDPIYKVFIDTENSVYLRRMGEQKKAEEILLSSKTKLENIKVKSRVDAANKNYLANIYFGLARLYYIDNNHEKADFYYTEALKYNKIMGDHAFLFSYINIKYADLLNRQGEYKKAYSCMLASRNIDNEYLDPRKKRLNEYVTIKNPYAEKLEEQGRVLKEKEIEITQKRQKLKLFRIYFFTSILLFFIGGLIIRNRNQRLKHKTESKKADEELQESKEIIALKNRELTSAMLQLIEKNETLNTIKEQLSTSENKKSSINMINSLTVQSTSLWETFNSRFLELNKGFYEKLQLKHPNLSPSDLKVCALIKLSFSGKEMASLLGISVGGINLARHRLRKKMSIDRKINLTTFINSI